MRCDFDMDLLCFTVAGQRKSRFARDVLQFGMGGGSRHTTQSSGGVISLGNAAYLKAFTPEQLGGMAYLPLKLHGHGFAVSLIFFGCYCLVMGYLIFKSEYLPKALGVLMQVAGACYLMNSFALLLAPHFADRMFPAILVPAFVAEVSLAMS